MSLRLRLTLLYSTFMGGILLIFGAAVYLLVNVILLNQVDTMLAGVANDITDVTRVNSVGELNVINLPPLDMTSNAYVQVWGLNGKIIATSPSIGMLSKPLDPVGLETHSPIYKDSYLEGARLRVLSVPLVLSGRMIGTLQVGASLGVVDATQGNLISVMALIAVIGVLTAGIGSWVILGRALSPLEDISEAVDQINRADDLSRRIPYHGRTEDEIGDLVISFNQTLERLESLFTSQQRFLADVSHELRTPLTVIKGYMGMIKASPAVQENPMLVQAMDGVIQGTNRLHQIVNSMLDVARLETQVTTPHLEAMTLGPTLRLIQKDYAEDLKARQLTLELDPNINATPPLLADSELMKKVLDNVIVNAIKFTPDGGRITVSAHKVNVPGRGEVCEIRVKDSGIGIDPENHIIIFEKLYQIGKVELHSSGRTKFKGGGPGLGLAIAAGIVKAHQGKIWVESKGYDEVNLPGSTFFIQLPFAK